MAHTTLRNILSLASGMALAWLATACQSGADEPRGGSDEMVFTTEGVTRSTLMDKNSLTAFPFAVYGAMYSLTPEDASQCIPIYEGTEVRYESSGQQWTYDEPRYWFPGFQYSLVALHPAAPSNVTAINYSDNQLGFTYSQPADYRDADDILVSTHRRRYAGGSTSAVGFTFHHILSNVSITMSYIDPKEPSTSTLNITGLTFKNVPTRASYAVAPAQVAGGGDMTNDWTCANGSSDGWKILDSGDVEILFPADGAGACKNANDETPRPLFSDTDALLLLPNAKGGTELELTYVIADSDGVAGPEQKAEAVIPTGWTAGQNLVLALSINEKSLKVSITVAEWEPTAPVDTTVPRK